MTDSKMPYYPYPTLTREEASQVVTKEIDRFFNDFLDQHKIYISAEKLPHKKKSQELMKLRLATNIHPMRRQIIAPAGIGKTTKVIQNLRRCRGMNIWFMVPTQELANELAGKMKKEVIGMEVIAIKGRREGTCNRHEVASSLGAKSINVQESLCNSGEDYCDFYAKCTYQKQKDQLDAFNNEDEDKEIKDIRNPRVFVMVHAYLVCNSSIPNPDLIVVDESHWQSFIDITGQPNSTRDIGFDDLRDISQEKLLHSNEYNTVINIFINRVQEYPENFLSYLQKQDNFPLEQAIKYIDLVLSSKGSPNIKPKNTDRFINDKINIWEKPILEKIKLILEVLLYELQVNKRTSSITVDLDAPKPIRIHSTKPNIISKKTPALLIDASASFEINQRIWGRSLQSVEIKAERNCIVKQVKEKTFSKASLGIPYNSNNDFKPDEKAMRFRQEVIHFINGVAESTKGEVLLVTYKNAKNILLPDLQPNVVLAHFGNIRGSNEYEDCDAVIILGREEPSIKVIEGATLALLFQNKKNLLKYSSWIPENPNYARLSRNRRMTGKDVTQERVRKHPDNLAQEVLEQIREREIEQELDRSRLMHGDKKKAVYLLTSIPCDIAVDECLNWDELSHNTKLDKAILRALEKGKAFTLSNTDLARLYPDMWASRDAIKGYIKRHGGINWVVSLIRYYIPNDPLYEVQYRAGKQKRWSKAIIAGEDTNIKDALESLLAKPCIIGKIVTL